MARALLDVNVLLALLDADHVDHERTQDWLADSRDGWASCAITENGLVVRIMSQPRYPSPIPPSEAMDLLRRASESDLHAFWACDISLLHAGVIHHSRVHGSRQVTGAYLLALAVALD